MDRIGGKMIWIWQKKLKKNIADISQKHGVIKVSIFGSYARGEQKSESDIDILVEFESGRTLFDLIRLERELREQLGVDIDVVTPKSLHPKLRESVLKEMVPVIWAQRKITGSMASLKFYLTYRQYRLKSGDLESLL